MSWPKRFTEEQTNKADAERLRDTFAAAALTGLIASREWPIDSEEAAHYCYRVADAMLRERSRTGQTAAGTPPQSRAGQSAAESVPEVAKCTERGNDHDAAPEARVQQSTREPERSLLPQSDAVERGLHRTGNTSSPELYGKDDEKRTNTNTSLDTTPSEGSVRGEGTVGERLVDRLSITHTLLADNERLRERMRLTAGEREAVEQAIDSASGMGQAEPWTMRTLRNLLERLT
jgi:hypothetical protein